VSSLDPAIAARLKRGPDGLVPAVAQQYDTGEVLMLAWMDDEALHRTLTTGRATYWSRSRGEYWVKGDTSGHVQHVRSVALDCDGDTLLVRVDQVGAACHTGTRTCFDGRDLPLTADLARPTPSEPAEPADPSEPAGSDQTARADAGPSDVVASEPASPAEPGTRTDPAEGSIR
jgi:phosphoribosyl-AMP cyclohydrolase